MPTKLSKPYLSKESVAQNKLNSKHFEVSQPHNKKRKSRDWKAAAQAGGSQQQTLKTCAVMLHLTSPFDITSCWGYAQVGSVNRWPACGHKMI